MLVDRGTVRENVPADITATFSQHWMRAMYLPYVGHLLQEMDAHILVAQKHYVVMCPMTAVESERIVQLYEVFQDNMSGDRRQL